jgi:hypothetical protein
MRVLLACEESGACRREFRALGHDAWSCDLLPAADGSEYHIQGNVLDALDDGWDMMIAFPPCTRLCNSGVRWLRSRNLWGDMRAGAGFFLRLLDCDAIPLRAIENPISHKYAREIIGRYDQIIQPWQFGHGETKATCLWLRGLPPLEPTDIAEGRDQRIHKLPPSADRALIRSRTYQGIARAMAEQWGHQYRGQRIGGTCD